MHRIAIGAAGKPFAHFYLAFGYANIDYTTTAPTRRMYDHLSSYARGGRYMRLHNVLTMHGEGDRYFLEGQDYGNPPDGDEAVDRVFRLEGDRVVADWTEVDRAYDLMLAHGFRPIVETHRLPSVACKGDAGDRSTPASYRRWGECVRLFTEHVLERYGRDEVLTWWFEVWNEPDNHRAYNEDPQKFNALYDYMEAAVHGVDPDLRVGGPAVKQGQEAFAIFGAFLEHCANGVNFADGTIGTRVDFISVHCKGGRPEDCCPNTNVMFRSLRDFVDILERYPQFKGLPFFNDESDIIWAGNLGKAHKNWLNFRSTHYFPGFVCKMVDRYCREVIDDWDVNLEIVDSDNCHQQWERGLFSGNRAQLTPLAPYPCTDLIRKAAFNAYPLLARLGDERLATTADDPDFGAKYGALATRGDGVLAVMAWHFEDGMEEDVPARRLVLEGTGLLPDGAYRLVEFRIDRHHSNPYQVWKDAGMPAAPSADLVRELRRREGLEPVGDVRGLTVTDSAVVLETELPMHAVALFVVVPADGPLPAAPAWWSHAVETGATGAPQVILKWRPCEARNFLHYRLLRGEEGGPATCLADHDSFGGALYVDTAVTAGTTYTYTVAAVTVDGTASPASPPLAVTV